MPEIEVSEQKQTWKERRRQQLYDELMRSAIKLFGEKGFDEPSVDQIVAETGVAKGTFYLYFKSKSDIIQAVIESGLSELEQRVASSIAAAPEQATVTLARTAQEVLGFFEEHHAMIPLLMSGQGMSSNQLSVEVRDELRKRHCTATTGAYERIIRKGMLQGHFREIEAHTAATAFSGMLAGLVYEALEKGNPLKDVSEQALDLLEKGIGRKG